MEAEKIKISAAKSIKIIFDILFPIISIWLIIAYYRKVSHYNLYHEVSSWIVILFFIPVAVFEVFSSAVFGDKRPIKFWPEKINERVFLTGRIVSWLFLFYFWVIKIPGSENPVKYVELAVANVMTVPILMHAYRAESYLSVSALIIWFALYYIITVRKKIFRFVTVFILPVLLTSGLYYHFYYMGGIGEASAEEIESQKGVEIFYTKRDFPRENYSHYYYFCEINSTFPRRLYVDPEQEAIFVNYGNTFNKSVNERIPNILRIDLNTKETKYFLGRFIRAFSARTDSIYVSPFHENWIYELDKKDLSVIRKIPIQVDIYPWEVMDIYQDEKNGYIYVANEINPGLFKYDVNSGKLLGSSRLEDHVYGGSIWNIRTSYRTGKLYVITYMTGQDLLEIDPHSFEIERKLDLGIQGMLSLTATELLLDDERGVFYIQHGGLNDLYEVDMKSFKVIRVLDGEVHARCMALDKKRDIIYISSFFYGKLIALDIKTGKHLWEVKVGGKPYGLDLYVNELYVNSRAGIVKIDLNTVWNEYKKGNL